MKTATASLVLLVLLAAADAAPEVDTIVEGLSNVEDFALLNSGDWVVGSGMAGGTDEWGTLYFIDTRTKAVRAVYPAATPPKSATAGACPTAEAPVAIKPHGITLTDRADGTQMLYVVSHGPREAIEMFSVTDGRDPELAWAGCILLPDGAVANSVAVAAHGTIYITAQGGPFAGSETLPSVHPQGPDMSSGVLAWTSREGWRKVAGTRVPGANGLLVKPDGERIYVASWPTGTVVEVTPGETPARRVLELGFLPDNLRWDPDGTLWVAGHDAVAPIVDCYHSERDSCTLPYNVARIDPASFRKTCSQHLSGTPDFGGATVAFPVESELWLGSFRGEGIAIKTRAELQDSPDACVE